MKLLRRDAVVELDDTDLTDPVVDLASASSASSKTTS